MASTSDHGTTARYARGCRCDACRRANAAYMRDFRRRTGSKDRVAVELERAAAALREESDADVPITVTLTPLAHRILLATQLRTRRRRHEVIDELLREHGTASAVACA